MHTHTHTNYRPITLPCSIARTGNKVTEINKDNYGNRESKRAAIPSTQMLLALTKAGNKTKLFITPIDQAAPTGISHLVTRSRPKGKITSVSTGHQNTAKTKQHTFTFPNFNYVKSLTCSKKQKKTMLDTGLTVLSI